MRREGREKYRVAVEGGGSTPQDQADRRVGYAIEVVDDGGRVRDAREVRTRGQREVDESKEVVGCVRNAEADANSEMDVARQARRFPDRGDAWPEQGFPATGLRCIEERRRISVGLRARPRK